MRDRTIQLSPHKYMYVHVVSLDLWPVLRKKCHCVNIYRDCVARSSNPLTGRSRETRGEDVRVTKPSARTYMPFVTHVYTCRQLHVCTKLLGGFRILYMYAPSKKPPLGLVGN